MSACVACGNTFQCGMADAGAPDPCWCTLLPPLPAARLQAATAAGPAACYCPDCLRTLVTAAVSSETSGSSETSVSSDTGSSSGTVAQRDTGKT